MFSKLNQYSGDWLNFIQDSSLQLAVFFVIVSLLCWLTRKRSARFLHVLWLFFLIKILIPPSISLPLPQQPQILPQFSFPAITLSAEPGTASGLTLSSYIFMTWLLVMAGLFVFFLYKNISFRLSLKRAVPIENKRLPSSLLMQMKSEAPVKIYMIDHICSPFAVNFFKPRIYLPLGARDWNEKQLEAVLMHEMAHIERKDLWISLLQNLVQIVYFFHPLVWAANRQIAKYRERACDDLVIARSQHRALEYSKLLLASIDQMLQFTKCPTLINGFRQKQKALLKRFEYLINRKEEIMSKIKPGERMVLVLVCVFAFMLSVLSYAGKNRMAGDIYPENPIQIKAGIKIKKYDTLPKPVKGYSELEKNLVIPEILKNRQISGTAVFYVRFDDDGKIIDTLIARSLDEKLDEALLNAVKKVRWTPAYLNKKPVPAVVQIPVQVKIMRDGSYTLTLGSISKLAPPPPPPSPRVAAEPDVALAAPALLPPPPVEAKPDVVLAPLPSPPPRITVKPDVAIAPVPSPPAQKVKGTVSIVVLPEPEGGMEAIKKHLVLVESFKRQIKHDEALIKVLVDAKGQVKEAEVVYGAAEDEVRKKVENAVLAALKKIKWKPATKAGKPITAWVKITIKFD